MASTIAIRYSCVRKQGFKVNHSKTYLAEERQIIDWSTLNYPKSPGLPSRGTTDHRSIGRSLALSLALSRSLALSFERNVLTSLAS